MRSAARSMRSAAFSSKSDIAFLSPARASGKFIFRHGGRGRAFVREARIIQPRRLEHLAPGGPPEAGVAVLRDAPGSHRVRVPLANRGETLPACAPFAALAAGRRPQDSLGQLHDGERTEELGG